jgi:type II secretory pathway component HofQ
MLDAQHLLVKEGILPAEMPANYTFNKVRSVLAELDETEEAKLYEAVKAAKALSLSGPLATIIFIKHHLAGAHEVEVDRVVRNEEEGKTFAVLVYAEGEVTVSTRHLPENLREGSRLSYDPKAGNYSIK